ncbi:MAG: hypothetical protein JW717_00020 [Marinilabiliaceae bacterium]|nr:hypothetical protein [Marinilabiliaceae bacterium]
MNDNWKFYCGDTINASSDEFNDSCWLSLDLPHDWSIEGVIYANNPSGNNGGYFLTGIGWYRENLMYLNTGDLNV